MEDDLEEIKVGLQTLLLKHDDISKNVSICNTALSNNDFLIVPRITDFVPSIQPNLKIKRFKDINRSILSDPSFDKPGKIDMIIGAELFYQILKDGRKIRLSYESKLQRCRHCLSHCHLLSIGRINHSQIGNEFGALAPKDYLQHDFSPFDYKEVLDDSFAKVKTENKS
ncbi:hypothetical protein TNCT_201511 [Trichonephila clavata]|uniref:Uncharacterized protein n=1 Tax=Trichonephila clavata TaxID=2740835 RepID=A0A8X6JL62_TRICU|nr:hypothetical protein TNCT_201511 [Trichonephila clavata]